MRNKKTKLMKEEQVMKSPEISPSLFWVVAIILFLVIPLFYFEKAIDPVLIPRMLVLSIALFLLYLFFLINKRLVIVDFRLLKLNAVICWFIFIAVSLLSIVKAVNPMEGLFDVVRLFLQFLLLIVLSSFLIRGYNLKPVITAISILTFVYLVVGYYQYFSKAFGKSDLEALYNVTGIWTHKNFFSSMLFLVIPALVSEVLLSVDKKRYLHSILIFLSLSLIFLLQTRSVWMSVIVFIISLTGFLLIFRRKLFKNELLRLKRQLMTLVAVLVLALLASGLVTQLSLNKGKADKKATNEVENKSNSSAKIENIDQRAVSIFDTKERNIRHRFDMWKMSIGMIKDNPILGVGAGNWRIVVGDYLPENYNAKYFNNIRRPHNDLLWIFSEKGVFGILSYLLFFGFLLIYVIKTLRSADDDRKKLLSILAISAIAGYFADAMLSFPYERIEHQIMLMFYASVVLVNYFLIIPISETTNFFQTNFKMTIITIVLILVGTVLINQIWLREEFYVNKAQKAIVKGNWNRAIRNIDKATTRFDILEPRNTPALWFRGTSYLELKEHDKAFEDLKKAFKQNPNSRLVLVDLGMEYAIHGDFEKSIELLKKALKINPNNEFALKNLAVTYYNTKDYKEALRYFIMLDSIKPSQETKLIIESIKSKKLSE